MSKQTLIVNSLQEMYSFLWNYALKIEEESVLDTFITDYMEYGIESPKEIFDILEKYIHIDKHIKDECIDYYEKEHADFIKRWPGGRMSCFIDTEEVMAKIFNVDKEKLDDEPMYRDYFVCTLLAIILYNDVTHRDSICFNKMIERCQDFLEESERNVSLQKLIKPNRKFHKQVKLIQ